MENLKIGTNATATKLEQVERLEGEEEKKAHVKIHFTNTSMHYG